MKDSNGLTSAQQREIRNIAAGQARSLSDPAANYALGIVRSEALAQGKTNQVVDEREAGR